MTDECVIVSADGPVRVVTLNRPDARNAFSAEMHLAVLAAFREVCADPKARAVVLTGAGRAFSAGGDIDDFAVLADDLGQRRARLREGRQIFEDLVNVHLPVVAAVNGPAVGLGCTLAAACDIVHISEATYMADPHVQVALVAGDGGAVAMPLNIGLLRAKRYLLLGDRIPAADAVALGLATYADPADQLMANAMESARKLADLPPQAVQDTKMVLNQHLRQASVSMLGYGLAAESQSHDTSEYRAVPEKFAARKG
ncbi:enoyl-CoA hydratase/isomerase family protein [Nocardia coffeae]|uniref:enoyl-CoA hydratase/isomerase family protein n=1 Tax=Nocardia coffeae TaxID=2873381 RepID=UPI001F492A14|nr:enoyl-CoA hydratase/isomerase family protein [Nocardia coffeae]